MTNQAPTFEPISQPTDPFEASHVLRNAIRYFETIRHAAESCSVNLDWLHAHQAEFIPCLDTDVIFASIFDADRKMPTWTKGGLLTGFEGEAIKFENLYRLTGPHKLRHYLDTMHQYSLPPGTILEILARQRQLQIDLSKRGRELLEIVESSDIDVIDRLILHSRTKKRRKFGEILRENVEIFAKKMIHVHLLREIVNNATKFEDLTRQDAKSTHDTELARQAYRAALDALNRRRGDIPKNNACDAMNVGMIVQCFNTNLPTEKPLLPLLITDTEPVWRSQRIVQEYLQDDGYGQKPIVLSNPYFLGLIGSLLGINTLANRASYQAASDTATNLEHDAKKLANACRRLWEPLRISLRKFSHKRRVLREAADVEAGFEQLYIELSRFESQWQEVLDPQERFGQMDREVLVHNLFTPSIMLGLESRDRKTINTSLNSLKDSLRQDRQMKMDLWGMLLEYGRAIHPAQQFTSNLGGFRLSTSQPDSLLSELHTPKTDQFDKPDFHQNHKIRIACHLPIPDGVGAFMAVDSWRNKPKDDEARMLRVTWIHRGDVDEVWRSGTRLLKECMPQDNGGRDIFQYKTFGSRLWDLIESKKQLGWTSILSKHLEERETPNLVEALRGSFAFSMECGTLNDTGHKEFQAGFIFREPDLKPDLIMKLADALSDSAAERLPRALYSDILEHILLEVMAINIKTTGKRTA